MSVIRNEELILIYTEANIQLNNFTKALTAINLFHSKHNLPNYSGTVDQP